MSQAKSHSTTERTIRPAFLQAIRRLQTQIDTDELTSLLQQGRVDEALYVVERALETAGA